MCLRRIKRFKQFKVGLWSCLVLLLLPRRLFASPRMPWDDSLMVLQQALTGTTAHFIIAISIALSGLMWAVGEQGSLIQKAGKIIFGGTIATSAVSICSALRLFGGG